MATYVMGDVHGRFDLFTKLLNKINFKKEDTLYILGDVLDRGPEPIEVLQYCMKHENINLLMGNHELMALNCLKEFYTKDIGFIDDSEDNPIFLETACWLQNGALTTTSEFIKLPIEQRLDIIDYLENDLLWYDILEVNDNIFILVHAGFKNFDPNKELDEYEIDDLVWERPSFDKPLFDNEKIYVIVGHTPTPLIEHQLGLPESGNILHKNRYICLDCGACFEGGKLGCLCLETMEEFYASDKEE